MTDEEREEIRKLKESVSIEFFGKKPEPKFKPYIWIKPIPKGIKKNDVKEIKIEDISNISIINDIFLHSWKEKRIEQLRKINNARMEYSGSLYREDFEKLDSHIDQIEEDIFNCSKVSELSEKYQVKGIVFALWCRGTIYIERIRLAYELSAESRMDLSAQTLEDGINDPNLQIQYAGLIRELSLHHSRMGGFQNQKKYGKKPDIEINARPIQNVTDDQMDRMIAAFREDRMKQRALGSGGNSYIQFDEEAEKIKRDHIGSEETIEDVISNAKASKEAKIDEKDKEDFDLNEL